MRPVVHTLQRKKRLIKNARRSFSLAVRPVQPSTLFPLAAAGSYVYTHTQTYIYIYIYIIYIVTTSADR